MTHDEIKEKINTLLKESHHPDLTHIQIECESIGHIPVVNFASTGYTICEICLKII